MRKIAGEVTVVTSPKGVKFEYWFGVECGKRYYLVCPVGSFQTQSFMSLKSVMMWIERN